MTQVSDWIKENCTTVGTGALTLTGSDDGFARFGDAFTVPKQVWYVIIDGINHEAGVGVFNGVSSITRDTVNATMEGGVFNDNNPSPIYLNGSAVVACAFSADAYRELLSLIDGVATDLVVTNSNVATNATNISNNAASISNNANNISTNASNISINATDINTVEADIATNVTSIATNTADITALESSSNQYVLDIAANTAAIAVNNGDIDALETTSGSHTTAINTNTTNIATNAADITTNTNEIVVINDDLAFRESAVSALESGGVMTQDGDTGVYVLAGRGEVIDSYTDPENQARTTVTWIDTAFDLLTGAGMPVVTGLGYTEIGVTEAGVITAYPNGITSAQRKVVIKLGTVEYVDRAITMVVFAPIVSNQIGSILLDLLDFVPASNRINGLVLRPTNLNTMTLWRDSGIMFSVGINYQASPANQNTVTLPSEGAEDMPKEFSLVSYNNGSTVLGAEVTVVPTDEYEPDGAGSLDAIANGKTSIHYMYQSLTGGHFYFSYGQKEYDTYPEAINNLFADRSSHLVPVEFGRMLLLGQIVAEKGAILWDNITSAIYPINSATSSGSSGGSAADAINVAYSDTFSLGNNVQTAIDSLAVLKLTTNQNAAIDGANLPSVSNVLATMNDLMADVNLGYTPATTNGIVTNTVGDDATLLAVDGVNAGLMLPTDKAKLDAIIGDNTGDQDLSGLVTKTGDQALATGEALSLSGTTVTLTKGDTTSDTFEISDSGSEHYDGEGTPASPSLGATWYRPSTSITYKYVNDGTSSFWLDISTAAAGAEVSGGGGGEANTASNSGAGAGLSQTKVGTNLPFKSVLGSANVTITEQTDTITIESIDTDTTDHTSLGNIGLNSHTAIDDHINATVIHFTEASIDHANIVGIGANTHIQIDDHIGESTIHFTEASIDHANIIGNGTNTHAQIDDHITATDIHYTQANISILETQVSDLGNYVPSNQEESEGTLAGNILILTNDEYNNLVAKTATTIYYIVG